MKWQAGQRVHYVYNPGIGSGHDRKDYYGEITDTNDSRVYIQWDSIESIESYGSDSFIITSMTLIPELAEDNPNRKFKEENTYGDKV